MSRKQFNFYRSFYDVALELEHEDRLNFLMAILKKQFEGVEPDLSGMAKFAYISQKHSIDAQVAGYEQKTGVKLTPYQGGTEGGTDTPSVQGKGKGERERERGTYPPLTSFKQPIPSRVQRFFGAREIEGLEHLKRSRSA